MPLIITGVTGSANVIDPLPAFDIGTTNHVITKYAAMPKRSARQPLLPQHGNRSTGEHVDRDNAKRHEEVREQADDRR